MRNRYAVVTRILALSFLVLNSCHGDSSSGIIATSTTSVSAGTISSSVEGAYGASQIAQTRELLLTGTQMFKNLGDIAIPLMSSTLSNQNTDIACTDGGTFQYSGVYSAPTYSLTFTFNGCRDQGYQYVGSYTLTGTPSDFSIALGGSSTFNIFNFDVSYTILLAYLKANLTFTMVGSGTSSDAVYTITSNGSVVSFDYFLLDTFTMNFSNLKTAYTLSTDSATNDQLISITSDGQFRESWGGSYIVTLQLTSFKIDKLQRYDSGSSSFSSDETSLDGTADFSIRPLSFGLGGTVVVTTQTPVKTVYASPRHTTQGTLTLNTTSTVQYNTGGDVQVTFTGDSPLQYAKEYDLMKLCDFAAMEQNKPALMTPPATGSPVSLPTGSTMAVTLTWTGPAPSYASTSDMDLHLKYYNVSNPTGTDVETWHIDWHQGKTYPGSTGSCTDPAGISFSDAFDLDGDHTGTCEVGLDFDDTNGYGPEHITALKIPAGYYVISVDSFALNSDASAALYLSLNIGDNIIGPFTGTLSDSDGEGTKALAWFRVADVRVNADGSIDVLAPDTMLNPWH